MPCNEMIPLSDLDRSLLGAEGAGDWPTSMSEGVLELAERKRAELIRYDHATDVIVSEPPIGRSVLIARICQIGKIIDSVAPYLPSVSDDVARHTPGIECDS